ncbi:hypothetical protein E1A91_A08G262800v1 [Gossypium mustelinum]|uniref:IBH1-like N-terminal domain-containing protein n=2 Tax=Gossypium TaxID=3633 RepID=A0ABR0P6R2_GOSAR|nr:transcription factor IBH1-like 1 [Gossypium arboreum]XP_052874157.1 transcription factor IBH1-like 1 [Gossypium arboreum]KAK5813981.1 hypothetical protein PVK06_029432 [Gossypium arboreum]TYJ24472.1 hypothetical protein E1A91_A08G262800v1 [Gossypium mustelinum]
MHLPHSTLKQEFVKKWIMGLQRCKFSNKNMSIFERKKAIKLSADTAMASARKGLTCWSRALISTPDRSAVPTTTRRASLACKKIVKRSRRIRRTAKCGAARKRQITRSIAQCLVRKRTQILKSLIPGGEFMNEVCLIEETLDYITSLRVQVDVMRSLASASVRASEPHN